MFSKIRSLWYKICDDPILLILFMISTAIGLFVVVGLYIGWLAVVVTLGGVVTLVIITSLLERIFPTFIPERWIPVALPIVGVAALLVQYIANGLTMQDFFATMWAKVSSLLGT